MNDKSGTPLNSHRYETIFCVFLLAVVFLYREAFAKIFKPFNTTKAPGEGTGIGLYVCRQIAVDHSGRLHVENREEGGARFILSLPAAQAVELHARAA